MIDIFVSVNISRNRLAYECFGTHAVLRCASAIDCSSLNEVSLVEKHGVASNKSVTLDVWHCML